MVIQISILPFRLVFTELVHAKAVSPADYIITFSDQPISIAKNLSGGRFIDIPVNYKVENVISGIPIEVVTICKNRWQQMILPGH